MAEIVNLKRTKKAKARAAKEKAAEENRAKFGTPKAIHNIAKARAEKEARAIEGHKKT